MQKLSRIRAPVAAYLLGSVLSPPAGGVQGGGGISSRRRTLICEASLSNKQKKQQSPPPSLSAGAADISHNDDSRYSMHPTKFNNKLTFFYCSCFYDNARAPAATLKRDKHKSQKMDLIDLASLHGIHIQTDRGV